MSWVGPDAEPHRIETNNTELSIKNGVFGGFEFLLTLCFTYLPVTVPEDCVYNTVQMPEGVPIKGPNLRRYTKQNDLV
jgi:hypothetical protein